MAVARRPVKCGAAAPVREAHGRFRETPSWRSSSACCAGPTCCRATPRRPRLRPAAVLRHAAPPWTRARHHWSICRRAQPRLPDERPLLRSALCGAFIVNTGSCQLIDDCALKQFLIDGTIAGCALDGAEGPQWMEAWVREMPNVLILPQSADYSEEVWMEIREQAITILQSFFFDGVVPNSAISDEDEEISEAGNEDDQQEKGAKDSHSLVFDGEHQTDESQLTLEYEKKRAISQHKEPQASGQYQNVGSRTAGRRSCSRKKGKKKTCSPQISTENIRLVCCRE